MNALLQLKIRDRNQYKHVALIYVDDIVMHPSFLACVVSRSKTGARLISWGIRSLFFNLEPWPNSSIDLPDGKAYKK